MRMRLFAFLVPLSSLTALRVPPVPWVVASDWDDTIKAGGHGLLFGIRGIGKRISGTYPGMNALLAELDPCWSGRECLSKDSSFQIWSAKPFGSKKQNSCSPPLHRRPVTRHGSMRAGVSWVFANKCPGLSRERRDRYLETAAMKMGRAKYLIFRKEAEAAEAGTELLFFGDSAQGDAFAASLIVDDAEHGERAFVFLHDLTRGVRPHEPPRHEDARIVIKEPFKACRVGWSCPRVVYYKTVPEAAFVLAQLGFLGRDSLRYFVETTRREMSMLVVQVIASGLHPDCIRIASGIASGIASALPVSPGTASDLA